MGKQTVRKITISLPKELLDVVDHWAQDRSLSRSGTIAAVLAEAEAARIMALRATGNSGKRTDEKLRKPSALRARSC